MVIYFGGLLQQGGAGALALVLEFSSRYAYQPALKRLHQLSSGGKPVSSRSSDMVWKLVMLALYRTLSLFRSKFICNCMIPAASDIAFSIAMASAAWESDGRCIDLHASHAFCGFKDLRSGMALESMQKMDDSPPVILADGCFEWRHGCLKLRSTFTKGPNQVAVSR